jgi:hypothetical protein
MGRKINSDLTVTQLWKPITLRDPEDGGDMFFETSVLITAIRCNTPEDIYHRYRRENIPGDIVLPPYTSLYLYLMMEAIPFSETCRLLQEPYGVTSQKTVFFDIELFTFSGILI